jgi:hypothetical protein
MEVVKLRVLLVQKVNINHIHVVAFVMLVEVVKQPLVLVKHLLVAVEDLR